MFDNLTLRRLPIGHALSKGRLSIGHPMPEALLLSFSVYHPVANNLRLHRHSHLHLRLRHHLHLHLRHHLHLLLRHHLHLHLPHHLHLLPRHHLHLLRHLWRHYLLHHLWRHCLLHHLWRLHPIRCTAHCVTSMVFMMVVMVFMMVVVVAVVDRWSCIAHRRPVRHALTNCMLLLLRINGHRHLPDNLLCLKLRNFNYLLYHLAYH